MMQSKEIDGDIMPNGVSENRINNTANKVNNTALKISELISRPDFVRAIFSNRRKKSLEYSRVMMRYVLVKGVRLMQLEYTYEKKVIHENISPEEAVRKASELVENDFKQVNIIMENGEVQILCSKPDSPRVTGENKLKDVKNSAENTTPDIVTEQNKLQNNRTKNYIIPDGVPCDFLIRLGVMGEDGKVFQRSYSKFRQINRYLEIVEDCYPALESITQERPLRIIDFGCGKAYLTFALYYYMRVIKNRSVMITGLDLKTDVIEFCNNVSKDLGYDGLEFLMGDIADYTDEYCDMVVTLHACDTATDYALINAVGWNTKVILSVPCCQHELFRQIKNDIHDPMLKHGILKDRLTEYLTDGLRALKLEAKGYDVALIEFTSLEHTARNIMIKAVKNRPNKKRMDRAQAEYEQLRDFYHVSPTIDKL